LLINNLRMQLSLTEEQSKALMIENDCLNL